MNPLSPTKYGFRIRTRSGSVVENLLISGKDEPDAERKLRQMYMDCEILEARSCAAAVGRNSPVTFEDVVDLISTGH